MNLLKRCMCFVTVTLLAVVFTGCGKGDDTVNVPTEGIFFEMETMGGLINTGDTYNANESSFNFNIHTEAPEIKSAEPVDVEEAEFNFELEDFDADFAANVEEARIKEFEGLTIEEKELLIQKKENFLSDLAFAFTTNNISVMVDAVSGEIILDSAILFDTDESEVSEEGKAFLTNFIKAYASVVCDEKYKDFIDTILVEGHTDTAGTYSYNKTLSEKRAENVLNFCLSDEAGMEADDKAVLKNMIDSVGCSYDRPITDASGKVNMAASRRVTFRFLINIG